MPEPNLRLSLLLGDIGILVTLVGLVLAGFGIVGLVLNMTVGWTLLAAAALTVCIGLICFTCVGLFFPDTPTALRAELDQRDLSRHTVKPPHGNDDD